MKKIVIFLLVLVIIIFLVCVFIKIPSVTNALGNITKRAFATQIIPYDNNFEINRLKIKNQSFYYSNSLNDKQKQIYTCIANAIKNFENNFILQNYDVIDSDTTMEDVEKSMQAFFADHPEVFYVNNQYTVSTKKTMFNSYVEVSLVYNVESKEDLESKIVSIETKINEYLENIKDKDDFASELFIHDKIGKDVEYYTYEKIDDVPQECHTIYGVFIDNKAVCDGFSKALQILLDRKGIENILILGTLENEAHAWNLVKLDNEWYNIDLTSNKAIKDVDDNIILHTYFNCTTSTFEKTHVFENKDILPEANSDKYNYYKQTNRIITASSNFNTKFKQMLDNNDNKYLLEFATSGINNVPEKMVDFLSANKYSEYISNNKITYYTISDTYVLMKNK